MSGKYNETYFTNHPEEKELPGILYCVILINRKTFERECLKIGIAKGTNYRDVLRRSWGFKHYDIAIQRTYADSLYNVWKLEQALHEHFKEYQYTPKIKFGGWTECFKISPEIIKFIPSKKH